MPPPHHCFSFFFFNDTATTEIYTLSLHDALPIWEQAAVQQRAPEQVAEALPHVATPRSEEHTSELQSPCNLVCRLLLEKKKSSVLVPVQCEYYAMEVPARLLAKVRRVQESFTPAV